MKAGMKVSDFATEVQRQQAAKRDFIIDTQLATAYVDDGGEALKISFQDNVFGVAPTAHKQFAERLSIPAKYYDRMQTNAPDLLAINVTHWLKSEPQKRMVRTLDGNVRALLSDRYRRLDHADMMDLLIPTLNSIGDIQVVSCDLSPTKLFFKAIFPKIQKEVRKGDIVQSGIVISNSEVGAGSISVQPLIYRLVCSNGMIAQDFGMKKMHVGARAGEGEDVLELYKDDTLMADDTAFWKKVRDIIYATAETIQFENIVSSMKDATGRKLESPVAAITELANRYTFTEGETRTALDFLIKESDPTHYGLVNAITAMSKTVDSYERATQLEAIGGQVLALPSNELRSLLEAA